MLTRAVIVGAVIVRAGNYCLHGFARKAVVKSAGEENRSGGSAAMRAEGAHKKRARQSKASRFAADLQFGLLKKSA